MKPAANSGARSSQLQTIKSIATQFFDSGSVLRIENLGKGLINDTFLVQTDSAQRPLFVLQRINATVFPYPERITANLECLTRHLRETVKNRASSRGNGNFRLPALLTTIDASNCYIEDSGDFWRALSYIEDSQSLERIESSHDAEQVGFALGHFHNLVSDLNPDSMQDSLPGFHDAPLYLAHYDHVRTVRSQENMDATSSENGLIEAFVSARRARVGVLEQARRHGILKARVMHGDPKLNNILVATHDRKAVSLVDLDTVKPGLIHYDIGDCLRSACNRANESNSEAQAEFDLDICEAILSGYFEECGSSLNATDIDYLYDAIWLLPFELGLRFLTDFLEDNRYFKVEFAEQNLLRAKLQFRLVLDIEQKESKLRSMIQSLATRVRRS